MSNTTFEDELARILKKIRHNEYYSAAKSNLPEETQKFSEYASWAAELHQKEIDKLVTADILAAHAASEAKAVEEAESFDSWPLGWRGDHHWRLLVQIKGGKMMQAREVSDTELGHGRVVIEADIQDWCKANFSSPTPAVQTEEG